MRVPRGVAAKEDEEDVDEAEVDNERRPHRPFPLLWPMLPLKRRPRPLKPPE